MHDTYSVKSLDTPNMTINTVSYFGYCTYLTAGFIKNNNCSSLGNYVGSTSGATP
jgi:hypothetical protein